MNQSITATKKRKVIGWLVHLYTALAGIIGLFTLYAIYQGNFILAFWLMGLTVFIDTTDGTLARRAQVNTIIPQIDGALLDNMMDFINYVITPAFFLIVSDLLLSQWAFLVTSFVILSSAYQFSQLDAKTEDHFFKGFPCYWNFAVFYLYIFGFSEMTNGLILILLSILVFVPIKYIYPSRMDFVFAKKSQRLGLLFLTTLYGAATLGLLWSFPEPNTLLMGYSISFIVLYGLLSLYRTFVPLNR